jgi:hypothetical protein
MAGSIHLGTHQSPMALVLTNRRLLSFEISSPIGLGMGGDVKQLIGAAGLERSTPSTQSGCLQARS